MSFSLSSLFGSSSSSQAASAINPTLLALLPLLTQGNISAGAIPLSSILPLLMGNGSSGQSSAQTVPLNSVISAFLPMIQSNTPVPSSEIMTALLQVITQVVK